MNRTSALLLAALMGVQMSPVLADEVAQFDVQKKCKVDVRAYGSGKTKEACITDELKAKATLTTQWTRFSADSRSRCMSLVTDIAGAQSYVDLLTCLQVSKFAPR